MLFTRVSVFLLFSYFNDSLNTIGGIVGVSSMITGGLMGFWVEDDLNVDFWEVVEHSNNYDRVYQSARSEAFNSTIYDICEHSLGE